MHGFVASMHGSVILGSGKGGQKGFCGGQLCFSGGGGGRGLQGVGHFSIKRGATCKRRAERNY